MNKPHPKTAARVLCAVSVLLAVSVAARAEDVEKRWRLGFAIGGVDSRDEIRSDAANLLVLQDRNEIAQTFFEDPRNDDAATSKLQMEASNRAMISAQYAINKIFLVELSGGYQKGDVGNVEVQAQFTGDPIPDQDRFKFRVFLLDGGEIEQVPLKATALARFRPRAALNPYVGMGMGYTFVGYTSSSALSELSRNMDSSFGQFARLQSFPGGFQPQGAVLDIDGIEVKAPDTFTWHVSGGVEYTFRRKWAAFLDLTYSFASRGLTIRFDPPTPSVGISVPNQVAFETDDVASAPYGTLLVSSGGFIDAGRLVPPASDPTVDCTQNAIFCEFVTDPDGVPDPGFYYVKGGSLQYDDVSLLVGIRFTF